MLERFFMMESLIGAVVIGGLVLAWLGFHGIAGVIAQALFGAFAALAGVLQRTVNPRMRTLQRWALGFLLLALASLAAALILGMYRAGWLTLVAYLLTVLCGILAGWLGNAAEAEYQRATTRAAAPAADDTHPCD